MLSLALCLALVLMPPRRDGFGKPPPRGAEVPNADGVACCFVYAGSGNRPCGVTAASKWWFAHTADGTRLWCHADWPRPNFLEILFEIWEGFQGANFARNLGAQYARPAKKSPFREISGLHFQGRAATWRPH